MKAVTVTKIGELHDPDVSKRGQVEVRDIPVPEIGDNEVLIKVAYCAICGSDPHVIGGIFDREPPFGLGHEASGVIVKLGKKATVKGLKVGDRIAGNFMHFCGTCYYCQNQQQQCCTNKTVCDICMAEYLVWNEDQVYKLPDSISLKKGCLMEPTSVGVRAMDKANFKIGQRVLISGGGPIGLIILQLMKLYGATKLTLSEPIEMRRDLATKFGAEYVIDPLKQNIKEEASRITEGLGYDLVIDCSGARQAAKVLLDIASFCGTVMYVAQFPNDFEMPLNLYQYCYAKELTITGTNISPYCFPRTAAILEHMNFDDFVTQVFPIDKISDALEAHLTGKYPKVLISCNEDLLDL